MSSMSVDTIKVNVDNHTIYFYSIGKGAHTIVMETGLGTSHKGWSAVDTILAKNARVITYDRPGYLASDSCTKTRDAITVSDELHEALQKANIHPPFILVGWSLGGTFARVFSGMFPADVEGLLLVDPSPEESYERFKKESPEVVEEDSIYFQQVFASNRVGEKGELRAISMSMNQARMANGKYSGPGILLIASHGKGVGSFVNDPENIVNRIWVEELIKWADKHANFEYRVITSGHHLSRERPDVVVNAIMELMEKLNK